MALAGGGRTTKTLRAVIDLLADGAIAVASVI
jgi:hypothetical protein